MIHVIAVGLSVGVLVDETNVICGFKMRCDKCGQQMNSEYWNGLGILMLEHLASQCSMVSVRGIRPTGEESQ